MHIDPEVSQLANQLALVGHLLESRRDTGPLVDMIDTHTPRTWCDEATATGIRIHLVAFPPPEPEASDPLVRIGGILCEKLGRTEASSVFARLCRGMHEQRILDGELAELIVRLRHNARVA